MRKALVLASMLAVAAPAAQAAPSSGVIGWGCSVASTAAVTAAVVINAQTLSSVVSGVAAAPLSPALLYGGLGAIMVSSVCALGYHVAPVLVPSSPAPGPAVPANGGARVAQLESRTLEP